MFDGTHPNVAAGALFLNYRFASPIASCRLRHGFMLLPGATFPFAYETQTDPITGKTDGMLARCSASNTCPKLIHTISSTEYWQGGQSLITTDPLGRSDGTPPDNVRIYHFAGTQHSGVEVRPACRASARCRPTAPTFGRCCAQRSSRSIAG